MPKFALRFVTMRHFALAAALCVVAGGFAVSRVNWVTAADVPEAGSIPATGVGVEALGSALKALGLKAELTESRYDFQFAQKDPDGEQWELSMSVVLSLDGKSLWLMAWLDELPTNAADVPRTALLRMLADNDRIGNGQFFAYVSTNRRFVLQRVIANQNVTTNSLRADLVDLGKTVINTHPHWQVANWKTQGNVAPADAPPADEKGTEKSEAPATNTAPAPKSGIPSATKSGIGTRK